MTYLSRPQHTFSNKIRSLIRVYATGLESAWTMLLLVRNSKILKNQKLTSLMALEKL